MPPRSPTAYYKQRLVNATKKNAPQKSYGELTLGNLAPTQPAVVRQIRVDGRLFDRLFAVHSKANTESQPHTGRVRVEITFAVGQKTKFRNVLLQMQIQVTLWKRAVDGVGFVGRQWDRRP